MVQTANDLHRKLKICAEKVQGRDHIVIILGRAFEEHATRQFREQGRDEVVGKGSGLFRAVRKVIKLNSVALVLGTNKLRYRSDLQRFIGVFYLITVTLLKLFN